MPKWTVKKAKAWAKSKVRNLQYEQAAYLRTTGSGWRSFAQKHPSLFKATFRAGFWQMTMLSELGADHEAKGRLGRVLVVGACAGHPWTTAVEIVNEWAAVGKCDRDAQVLDVLMAIGRSVEHHRAAHLFN